MADVTYRAGEFNWTDLATTDPSGAKEFYSAVMGWQSEDMPVGGGATYTMLRQGGKDVAALSSMREDLRAKGVPPYWSVYVFVASADDAAARAKELGATILAPPFDVLDAGRMAVIADPTGAQLCLWQGGRHPGASSIDEPGALCWCELRTNDVEKARAFYEQLFGWSFEVLPEYSEIVIHGKHRGGVMPISSTMGPVPPHWGVYFMVRDLEAKVREVGAHGGKVHVPPQAIGGMGRFAVLADPQGASFCFYEETR